MKRSEYRIPKGYDGTKKTTRQIGELLPGFMKQVASTYEKRPDLLLAAWPSLIGPSFASMAQAVSFVEGILTVTVTNSTLYSLLNLHEKSRLLRGLQERFPRTEIKNIKFRIG